MKVDRGETETKYSFNAEEAKKLDQSGEAVYIKFGATEPIPEGGYVITLGNDGDRGYLPRALESLAKKLEFEFTGSEPLPPRTFADGTPV